MTDQPNFEIDYSSIPGIFESRSISEIKAAVTAFIAETDEVRDEYNGMFVWALCQRLEETFAAWSKPYSKPVKSATWNAVIVSPEDSPIMLLPSYMPFGSSPNEVITGLKRFISYCDELTPPIHEAITLTEMKRVLTAAQKAYDIIGIIAPYEPLKILRFDNSHAVYNSQCGISSTPDKPSTVYVFHPKENDVYDRVFIFAHELGHALHYALTGNVDVVPEGFEKFNEALSVKLDTVKKTQEAFADAVALAILNVKGLRTHFPTQFSKVMSPYFARYIKGLTAKKAGFHA